MKKVIILQNSNVSFGLDATKIYQPDKYELYLIANQFSINIVNQKNQQNFYKKIFTTHDFSIENILPLIKNHIKINELCNIITNSEETMPICGEIRKNLGV